MRKTSFFSVFKKCLVYLHQRALAFVSASYHALHSFASSNLDTFACAIDVRVSLTHNILLAPLDPKRATERFFLVFLYFQPHKKVDVFFLWDGMGVKEEKKEWKKGKILLSGQTQMKFKKNCWRSLSSFLFCFCNFERQSFASGFSLLRGTTEKKSSFCVSFIIFFFFVRGEKNSHHKLWIIKHLF